MGCYDTIFGNCPKCGKEICAQSKSGECILNEYFLNKVSINVSNDVYRHAPFICECGMKLVFERNIGQHGNYAELKLVEYIEIKDKEKWDEEFEDKIYVHFDYDSIQLEGRCFTELLKKIFDLDFSISETAEKVTIQYRDGEIRIRKNNESTN